MATRTRAILIIAVLAAAASGYLVSQAPSWAAAALLRPARTPLRAQRPGSCVDATFNGEAVTLKGWRCRPAGKPKALIVYLHGIADNRGSSIGIIDRFVARGLEVIAYDSRAHGESDGDACTYGFFEKIDLQRVLDDIETRPVVLIGQSLGAAVALQAAAADPRVAGVVAAETFSDLRTVATERAPFFFSSGMIAQAFAVADRRARFVADQISPQNAAARIAIPTLLIHGAKDVDTPPEHSKRVFTALRGPKRLILVPDAAHNGSLRGDVWNEIDQWVDRIAGEG